MSGTDPQRAEANRWFHKADEDFRSAQLMADVVPPLLDPAAYHCQQAAEKYLKGLLVLAGVAVPKTHDLWQLQDLVLPHFPVMRTQIQAVAEMSPWGIVTRYPGLEDNSGIESQDIRAALQMIVALHNAICA